MSFVANSNLTLGHDAIVATISILNSPSIKNIADSGAVWFEKISISLSNVQTPVITDANGAGAGEILPTSIKVSENGKNVLRVGDNVDIVCAGTAGGSPVSDTVTVTITDAGQSKVDAQ